MKHIKNQKKLWFHTSTCFLLPTAKRPNLQQVYMHKPSSRHSLTCQHNPELTASSTILDLQPGMAAMQRCSTDTMCFLSQVQVKHQEPSAVARRSEIALWQQLTRNQTSCRLRRHAGPPLRVQMGPGQHPLSSKIPTRSKPTERSCQS